MKSYGFIRLRPSWSCFRILMIPILFFIILYRLFPVNILIRQAI